MASSSERGLIARHAGTVLVGQLATMAFGVTDAIVAGRFAEGALAALSVGSAIFISVFVSLSGVLQALLPVWAELHGAGRTAQVGASLRQSLYLALVVVLLGMAVLLFPAPLLRWAEVPPEMRAEVETYLQVLAFSLAPALLFRLFSTLNQSLGRPKLITAMQIGSLCIKLPLSIWLTFGGGGMPAMGLVGCGIATLVVYWALFIGAIWLMRTRTFFLELRLWQRIEPPDWAQIRRFARLGLPAGMAVLVEVTSFTLMALFIARLGTSASASHQIAASLTAVAYMMPLSLSIATSARVSFWLGASDERRARGAVAKGLEMTLVAALLVATAMVALRSQLATIYSPNPAVVALASTLLLATAAYHLADAVQTLCVFLLRCYRITFVPLAIYGTLLWGLGLGGSYLLAYRGLGPWPAMQSPLAFWLMSAAALWITALLFVALLWRTLKRRRFD
ncbi:Multidrug resistance protein, MATE family [Burkholderiales bacterium 8X]|nr:Multidrug resistance protein, MATE family [Burkholderiales bacterium 8X]